MDKLPTHYKANPNIVRFAKYGGHDISKRILLNVDGKR
jgi:hypothetical protein